jgi:hypothetical protein
VKSLEAKLAALQTNSLSIAKENERLKMQLDMISSETAALKATAALFSSLPNYDAKTVADGIDQSKMREKVFMAGATWDYIIRHPFYLKGCVDIGHVYERLKMAVTYDGHGSVVQENKILHAIQNSIASESDELL